MFKFRVVIVVDTGKFGFLSSVNKEITVTVWADDKIDAIENARQKVWVDYPDSFPQWKSVKRVD